ncbi:hypothetical protein Cni_G07215 [Canna indica]|uniref:NAB domain-containing protein n=1 Tax=Canna indica TaxID=4628 RepID=A0AAQ3JZY4_9LILI|nr:hypothetical protein Cni_G07215 [Canna indica]
MATVAHAEPLHLYSGWGNHISPSNSKWIHENLKDMDVKVKAMFKLIEGDADSFARRADMYYKKRPELKKLVEEFYRGYRALAERYEHSTRMLRHAHGTMAEAFPNQVPFLSDESHYGLSTNEMDLHSPKMLLSVRTQFDSDNLKKEAFGLFSDFHVKKRNGPDFEESDSLSSRIGMKQHSQMLAAGVKVARADSSEGRVRKALNVLEEEVKVSENKAHNQDQEAKAKHDSNVINNLQHDISQLSSEIHVLKDQIMEESKRANNAENEIQSLMTTISKFNSDRDATLAQHQVSLERISSLELLLSHTENELKKLSNDMEEEVKKLKNVEELNQSLQVDLETLREKEKMQENEVDQKQEELEKIRTALEDKYQKCLEAELALQSSEEKYIESQEEVKFLGLEIQRGIEKLRDVELCNMGLQEEICSLKKENSGLNEQKIQDTLMIKGLQDEIILLEEKKKKLEDEVSILLQEKEVLCQELYRVKEDKNELERRHQDLVEKMQSISMCVESLQAAIKELQNGNDELKEICKKHEAEKELLVEKLKDMDKISDKNIILDKFLSDANIELEVLREKVATLETTHESLKSEISIYISERDSLASQVKILSENVDMLLGKNTFLENSLSDASREVENLRSKLKDFEDSCQFLNDKNSALLTENYTLVSRVDNIAKNLVLWESGYVKVMGKHLQLSIERDLMVNEVKELEDILKIEKQQHETHIQSYNNLLGTLDKQVCILQEDNQHKEKQIRKLLNSISDLEGDNQQMHLEISVLVTLLRHIGIDVATLGLQKYSLERELEIKSGKLLALENEKHELLERTELLIRDLEASKQMEEVLKSEIRVLGTQSNDLQEAIQATQSEISNLIGEKKSLSLELCNLGKQNNILEEEHVEVLLQAIELDHLYLLFHSLHTERTMELKSVSYDLESLHVIEHNLTNEINRLNEKMSLLEMEKIHFSDSVSYLEEELKTRMLGLEFDLSTITSLYEELNLHTDATSNKLIEKEMQITEANQKVKSTLEENMVLKELLQTFELDNAEIKLINEKMEEKVSSLSEVVTSKNEEIRCLTEENKMTQKDINEMHKRVEVLACREEQLVSELYKEASEVLQCEEEITAMLTDIQILTVNAASKEEKFHEMIVESETDAIVQKELLVFELSFAKEYIEELQTKLNDLEGENRVLKADMDDYLFMLKSLWDAVSSMEEQIMSISQLKFLGKQAEEDISLMAHNNHDGNQPSEINRGMKAAGILLLEKLTDKVKSLQMVIEDALRCLEQEMIDSNANLDAARKEVEILKMKAFAVQGTEDSEHHKGDNDQMVKDIQLDLASSSLISREVVSERRSINNAEIDEQSAGKDEDFNPSFGHTTEELIIDEFDSSKRSLESQQGWTKTVQERLDSDSQRLRNVKSSIEELKGRIDSPTDKLPPSHGYDSIKEQLKEAEAALLEMMDANSRLKMMAKDCASFDGRTNKLDDRSNIERGQISKQAKLGSQKVGGLEFKLQKIQYVLMKLEENYGVKQRRQRVVLRDYLYGRRDNHRQVKGNSFCGFVRPKTKGDY